MGEEPEQLANPVMLLGNLSLAAAVKKLGKTKEEEDSVM